MKKLILLIIVAVVSINSGFSQQVNSQQKITIINPGTAKKIADRGTANPLSRLNLPLFYSETSHQFLKSGNSVKLDSIIISSRTSDSSPWSKFNKQVFNYDDKLRIIEISSTNGLYTWSQWPEKAVFSYNAAGKVESILLYSKMPDYPDCCTLFKFTYDDMGRTLTAYTYYLNNGLQELYMGKNYFYNSEGKVSEILLEENWWSYWQSFHKYNYNCAGKLVSYTNDFYSINTSYEWNTEGNLIELHYQSWYQQRDQYYKYDVNGNRVKSERVYSTKQWNSEILTLQEKSSENFSYLDKNSSDLVELDLSLMDQNNELDAVVYCPKKLISTVDYRMNYSDISTNIPKIQKSQYFYSSVISDSKTVNVIRNSQNPNFNVYPNPATDQITFTWNQNFDKLNLKLFQVTGDCLLEKEISSNEPINISCFTKGIYLFRLTNNKEIVKTGKMVVE